MGNRTSVEKKKPLELNIKSTKYDLKSKLDIVNRKFTTIKNQNIKLKKQITDIETNNLQISNELVSNKKYLELETKYNLVYEEYQEIKNKYNSVEKKNNMLNNEKIELKFTNQELLDKLEENFKEKSDDNIKQFEQNIQNLESDKNQDLQLLNDKLSNRNQELIIENTNLIEKTKIAKSDVTEIKKKLDIQYYKNQKQLHDIMNNIEYHINKILDKNESNTFLPDRIEKTICKNTIEYIVNNLQ